MVRHGRKKNACVACLGRQGRGKRGAPRGCGSSFVDVLLRSGDERKSIARIGRRAVVEVQRVVAKESVKARLEVIPEDSFAKGSRDRRKNGEREEDGESKTNGDKKKGTRSARTRAGQRRRSSSGGRGGRRPDRGDRCGGHAASEIEGSARNGHARVYVSACMHRDERGENGRERQG